MGEDSKIGWTNDTWNPWRGCVEVSPGCLNCYARQQANQNPGILGKWGVHGTRVIGAESCWTQPARFDRLARAQGRRRRVFCASMADVFEYWMGYPTCVNGKPLTIVDGAWCNSWTLDQFTRYRAQARGVSMRVASLDDVRQRVWETMHATRSLDWLLVTKRPENVTGMVPTTWRARWPESVWLGITIESQVLAIRHQQIPACGNRLFWSLEPLLGPIDCVAIWRNSPVPRWVIVGGESGPRARPCDLGWIRSIVAQCDCADIPCFVKQLGSHVVDGARGRLTLLDDKGGDPSEWPEDLRVQQLPAAFLPMAAAVT